MSAGTRRVRNAAPAGAARAGRPLRVLHVSPAEEWRGGQGQTRLLMRVLRGRGGVEQGIAAARSSPLADAGRELGLEAYSLERRAGLDPALVATLARHAWQWDVLHAHDSHALQEALAALALSGARARLVASRRVEIPVRAPWVWRRADLVLAVSRAVGRSLTRRGLERRRIRVIYSGIDPRRGASGDPPETRGRLRRAAGADARRALIGAVGSLEPGKDHATFLRAAAVVAHELPGTRFVVAGEGPERSRLERLAAELGLEKRLALPGHIPDVRSSLSDLDLFVMTSVHEGLGTAALEALAAGLPVVLTRAGGLTEVAGDDLPLIPPEDPRRLAEELLRLLRNPTARAATARAAERRALRFSADRLAVDTLRAYRDAFRRVEEEIERQAALRWSRGRR